MQTAYTNKYLYRYNPTRNKFLFVRFTRNTSLQERTVAIFCNLSQKLQFFSYDHSDGSNVKSVYISLSIASTV